MSLLTPKQFIQTVFINELEPIVYSSPFIAFSIMAIGIEFLGKCLNSDQQDWNKGGSERNFKRAIKNLAHLKKYEKYLNEETYSFWDSFRNGFAHSFVPKKSLTLSSKNEQVHLFEDSTRFVVNLRCEDFFEDFKGACSEIIEMTFPVDDKMNKPFLRTP